MLNNNPIARKFLSLLDEFGKSKLNSLYPNEFEYYLCALELTNSSDKTIDFFVFPVMPGNISEMQNSLTNVKKTMGGISTLSSDTFIPRDITLSGNFGRRFRFLLGRDLVDANSIEIAACGGQFQNPGNQYAQKVKMFSNQIKTGYGSIKVLEGICKASDIIDDQGAYRLYFYNLALGNNYLVKVISLNLKQAEGDSNMIWNYTLNLKAIAPISVKANTPKSSLTNFANFQIASHLIEGSAQFANRMLFDTINFIS